MNSFNEFAKRCCEISQQKGWWENDDRLYALAAQYEAEGDVDFAQFLRLNSMNTKKLLVISEVTEAMEALRNDKELKPDQLKAMARLRNEDLNDAEFRECFLVVKETYWMEIADILIRLGDFCGKHDVDMDALLEMKMRFNTTRTRRHGGKAF